jgi:hypothetical protein
LDKQEPNTNRLAHSSDISCGLNAKNFAPQRGGLTSNGGVILRCIAGKNGKLEKFATLGEWPDDQAYGLASQAAAGRCVIVSEFEKDGAVV